MLSLLDSALFTWIVLPVLIFVARICDVSLGTIRVIFVSRGYRHLAPLLGFFEISIWLFAIGQIMRDINDISIYIAYAAGFATGTYVGITLEEKLSLGTVLVRVITGRDSSTLVDALKAADYGLTIHAAEGAEGPVTIVFTVVKRQELPRIIGIIKEFNPHAFYSVEDVRHASEGVFPAREGGVLRSYMDPRRFFAKKK
ncbi:MAG TPA: DUF2179 domain-containing protein [Methanomicrobiales archaeon]|nr:DUF2179 domain-containing protein [Methanomicrobiales archaeon]